MGSKEHAEAVTIKQHGRKTKAPTQCDAPVPASSQSHSSISEGGRSNPATQATIKKEKLALNHRTGQFEAFTGGDFRLIQDKGVDWDRIQSEKLARQRAREETEANQDRLSM
jgi:hypothetical protein